MTMISKAKNLMVYISNDCIYIPLKMGFYFWVPKIRFITTILYKSYFFILINNNYLYAWFFFNLIITIYIFVTLYY